MNIGSIRMNKKAVSPVIATLLMIAIAVASGTLVYVWSMGMVGTLQSSGGQQTKHQLIMEAYRAQGTPWTFNVRNTGSSTIQIASVYVNGTKVTPDPATPTLAPTASVSLTITGLPTGLIAGVGVPVKIITLDGAVFTFNVINGRSE